MIKVSHNIGKVAAELKSQGVDRAVRTEMAKGLTFAAQRAQRQLIEQISSSFDRPTPYTKRSIRIKPATADSLTAEVFIADAAVAEGLPPVHPLWAHVFGGERAMKATEKALVGLGLMRNTERMVPTRFAVQIFGDAYGNVKGLYAKVRSQLKLNRTAGSDSNATNSRRSRKKRAEFRIFVTTAQTKTVWGRGGKGGEREGSRQNLRRGIYVDVPGRRVRPIFLFVPAHYRVIFDFYGIVDQVLETELPRQMEKALVRIGRLSA